MCVAKLFFEVFTNITNRPAIAEDFNDEDEQEKLNKEVGGTLYFIIALLLRSNGLVRSK